MMQGKNWIELDSFLIKDNTYKYVEKLDKNREIKEFLDGLLEINDEFNINNKQRSNDIFKLHLKEVLNYINANGGENYKLARDVRIEIDNLDADITRMSDYYQNFLKIRAAITLEE